MYKVPENGIYREWVQGIQSMLSRNSLAWGLTARAIAARESGGTFKVENVYMKRKSSGTMASKKKEGVGVYIWSISQSSDVEGIRVCRWLGRRRERLGDTRADVGRG